ncbi:uncharacterized protein B0T23DRAFT_403280 [Neurospora hispaniola]|uniref:Uncharacterized protein n=1 Tax=Neurospora hispaniola TaxID=588809 RepID=A0AAJ0I9N7_9PEZI|nr:hypothetical protein B0T23DRAFT_403280 [Neurospora hispaniola]
MLGRWYLAPIEKGIKYAIDSVLVRGACKPGGWIEHVDITATVGCDDGTVVTGSALEQYGKLLDPKQEDVGLYAYAEVSSDFQGIIQFTFG